MKCMTQMPVIPMATPATSSQPIRELPALALARVAQRRPRNEPTNDMR
jgi:hypothetical protein